MDILLGLPGQIKKLLDRMTNSTVPLSDTRVGYLDASIAGRASQTSVDTIDTNVDSILSTVTTNLDAAVSTMGPVPPASFSNDTAGTNAAIVNAPPEGVPYVAAGTTWSDNTYKTLIDVTTGSGYLWFCALNDQTIEGGTQYIKITIDGTAIVWSGAIASGTSKTLVAVGAMAGEGVVTFMPVRFNTSLKIEIKSDVPSGTPDDNWGRLYYLYTLE